jgi:predicted flap endonuclease-1-like 5' DNA nuclease
MKGENADLQLKVLTLGQTIEALETENRSLSTALNLNEGEANSIEAIAAEAVEEVAEEREEIVLDAEVPAAILTTPFVAPELELTLDPNTPSATITIEDEDDFVPEMEEPVALETAARTVSAPLADDDHFSDAAFESFTRSALVAPVDEGGATDMSAGLILAPIHQDDLKIVEGIGPKIEELLFKAGIHTYSELAAAPVSRLKEILTEAGSRYAMHDPGTWSAQALLAANNEWDNLKAYQEFLDAGKRPGK